MQHLPLQPKPSKAPKPGVNIHEANEDDSNGIAGSGIETTIPEHFTQPSHTECRQQSANAWQELMPSLIHPLMAALHRMASILIISQWMIRTSMPFILHFLSHIRNYILRNKEGA